MTVTLSPAKNLPLRAVAADVANHETRRSSYEGSLRLRSAEAAPLPGSARGVPSLASLPCWAEQTARDAQPGARR
jgi:hypothetical protein